MRRVLLASVVLAILAAAPADAATEVKRFNAWSDAGDPLIPRYFHGSGDCTGASAVNPRADAWRCVSGTIALDPCFASPTDDEVFCAATPWALSGHLLSATLEPDSHGSSPAPGPWALQVGRRRCTYLARQAGKKGGPTYRCGRRGFLFGRPNKRKKTWTIRVAPNRTGRGAKRAKIRTAWD